MNSIGKYKIISELGSGGFGAVYLAEDPNLGEKVAIKVFRIKDQNLAKEITSATGEGDAGEILRQRFLDEARILRRLSSSPHIVSMHDFDTLEDGTPYYVMPYIAQSLVNEVGRDVFTQGKLQEIEPELHPRALPLNKAIDYLTQTLKGLKVVHQAGLVHRDIKPANLLLDRQGSLVTVVLCDFGIAKMPEGEHSKTGVGMGSPNYISPEQRESAKHVDARSDVFSVGVLAYRMLTGTVPIVAGSQSPKNFVPAIDDKLNQLILDAIDFEPAKRPADANAFLTRLQQIEKPFSEESEETGTWIEAGNAGLKDELKPLRDKIADLLKEHGEVSAQEKAKLAILAEMADLNTGQLDALIEETYQSIEQDVKPKRKFLEVLDNKLAATGSLNQSDHEALSSAASSVGWDEDTLNTIIERRTPTSSNKNKGKTSQQKPKKTQHQSQPNKHKNPIAWGIGLLLVCTLAYSAWWYNNLQEEQTDKVQQQINEEQQINKEQQISLAEETKTQEDAALAKREAAKLAAEVKAKRAAEIDATKAEAVKVETEKRRKAEAVIVLVKATQVELNRIGYTVGRADGSVGNKTRNAIKHYQKGNNLSPTGETSASLLVHLKQSTKKPGLSVGETFKDCTNCPEMVVIPAGNFQMGSTQSGDEEPVHRVTIAKSFAMGKYEVTWNDYQHCIDAGVCKSGGDQGYGKGNRPVINVSWDDAQNYTKWLSKQTGKQYRLPSEAEWEYAARAGSTTQYSWGDSVDCNKAQYDGGEDSDCNYEKPDGSYRGTARVGSYSANAFGLYDMHGNVWEWVQDCYVDNYNKALKDGRAYEGGECDYRVLRGGSWDGIPEYLRSAYRISYGAANRDGSIGFRLAQDL